MKGHLVTQYQHIVRIDSNPHRRTVSALMRITEQGKFTSAVVSASVIEATSNSSASYEPKLPDVQNLPEDPIKGVERARDERLREQSTTGDKQDLPKSTAPASAPASKAPSMSA